MNTKISAKVILDTKSMFTSARLTTLELVLPRFILAELNTHRMLSRNSASSRAIPFKRIVDMLTNDPFVPIAFQKAHSGMQGSEYITDPVEIENAQNIWLTGMQVAINFATQLTEAGVTKQIANRPLEAYMWHKVLISGTDWENFFELRCPQYVVAVYINVKKGETPQLTEFTFRSRKEAIAAIPALSNFTELDWLKVNQGKSEIHMMALAEAIYDAIRENEPRAGLIHLPYVDNLSEGYVETLAESFNVTEGKIIQGISAARCARTSYTLITSGENPDSIEQYKKDYLLALDLRNSGHLSPFEHLAEARQQDKYFANFRGFEQFRHILNL